MKHSEAIDALAEALAKAQGQMGGALKASVNPFFRSKYADLASVWNACRKPLADNGLSVVQGLRVEYASGAVNKDVAALAAAVDDKPPAVIVTTLLMHNSGQWIEEELSMWPRENTPQAIGTCGSYARRYGLAGMVGVYQEDDDGERATHGEGEHASLHDEAELATQVHEFVNVLTTSDAQKARQLWTEYNTLGTVGAIWKALNTKQKKATRDLLDQTATSGSQQDADQETTQ